MTISLEGNADYIIFFDDQHVQRFVTSFSTTVSAHGNVGEAFIEMVYAEAFMAIEYMTDVKIFVKNIFNGRYKMVFDGQIHNRQISITPTGRHIVFTAYDYMYWLQKLPVPFMLGSTEKLQQNVVLSWIAKGINVEAVATVQSAGEMAFAGKNMKNTLEEIFNYIDKALPFSADYNSPDKNSIYRWVNIKDKIRILSDFDARLRDDSVLDLFYKGSVVENTYVLLNGIVSGVGYEFYQDTDSIIKIKEPFWNDGIIKPLVVDSSIIIDLNENTNWDNNCTRVMVLGGIEEEFSNVTNSDIAVDIIIPAVLYVHDDNGGSIITDANTHPYPAQEAKSPYVKEKIELSDDEKIVRGLIVSMAERYLGVPYVLGGGHLGNARSSRGLDCSGLVYYAYRDAGVNIGCHTTFEYYNNAIKIKPEQLQPGDIGFSNWDESRHGWGHMGIYAGKITDGNGKVSHRWIQASSTRGRVVEDVSATPASFWKAFCNILGSVKGGFSGGNIVNAPTVDTYKPVTTSLTERERKYGINLTETVQSLIRVGYLGDGYNRQEAYKVLGEHAKYLHTVMNAAATTASLTTLAAPWARPGFNIWVDPGGLSRIYYINSVRHYGANGMVQTSFGLTYGRSEEEYNKCYNKYKGKPNNPLTSDVRLSAADYYLNNDKLDFITPDNMEEFKEYKKKVHALCDNKGAIPAHLSPYRNWYGGSFIRRNTDMLGRWDSDFNLFELYCIIAAGYGVHDVSKLPLLTSAPTTGNVNAVNDNERYISEFARTAINYDFKKAGSGGSNVPAVIRSRVGKLVSIIMEADKEVAYMYPESNINKKYTR